MSLGFLTESALVPSKAKPINVDAKSFVDLKAVVFQKGQERKRRLQEALTAENDDEGRLRLGKYAHLRGGSKRRKRSDEDRVGKKHRNRGVEARSRRDEEEAQREAPGEDDDEAWSRKSAEMLRKKAKLYDEMANGGGKDHHLKGEFLVNFEAKGERIEMQTPTPPGSADGSSPVRSHSKKPSPADFMFGVTLGEGAYARVVHARMKDSGVEYAVKIMEKRFIRKEKKVKFVMMERKVFSKISHDRVVKLFFTFQDNNYLYMVMELCRGGELLDVITKKHKEQTAAGYTDRACSLELTKFYIAEVVVALEYLHKNGVIHRDLKPENILLSDEGHLKVTDFGTAKDETEESRHNTFCGTAEYVSPEVLRDQEASRGCDLWAVACMVFQMLVGRPIFRAENEYLTFQQILNHPAEDFVYPPGFPPVAKDLIDRILLQEPNERLGAGSDEDGNGYIALKSHPFFEGIDWESVGYTQPPYLPEIGRLPPTEYDGATEDWLFAGVATELQVSSGLTLDPMPSPAEHVNVVEVARQKAAIPPPMRRTSSLWNRFLLDDELIKMGGLISKRKGLFSKKRQLILTSKPRLIYIDPIRMKQKGEIPWSDNLYVNSKSATAFDVVTPNRVYHLNDLVNGSKKWIEAINAALVRRM